MKWIAFLKCLFSLAGGLFLWREMDWPMIIWPTSVFHFAMVFIIVTFIIWIPLSSFIKRINIKHYGVLLLVGSISAYFINPLSKKTSIHPQYSHCSNLSYTGFFYEARNIFLDAYIDDFEAKNQMCWIRKMIRKVPSEIAEDEYIHRLSLLKTNLLKPDMKYRSSLPLIAILYGNYVMKAPSDKMVALLKAKDLYYEVEFWKEQYSEHIGSRDYSWANWPFSSLVKSEFHFIEENWNQIHLSVTLSE